MQVISQLSQLSYTLNCDVDDGSILQSISNLQDEQESMKEKSESTMLNNEKLIIKTEKINEEIYNLQQILEKESKDDFAEECFEQK